MKTIIFISFAVIVLFSTDYTQTQLLKVSNTVQYSDEGNFEWVSVTTKSVIIDGEEYFERKSYSPWNTQYVFIKSYEKIEGDSAYFILNASNQDSLVFNFNWRVGKKYFTSINGNIFNGQRIDSIKMVDTFLNDDTVYVLKNFTYNTTTSDTSFNVIPEYNHLSKKLGRLDEGLWVYIAGAKINGLRYGDVFPYPEEIFFSEDSIYVPTLSDSGSTKIVNTSVYPVRIDSIISVGSFYGYRGEFSKTGYQLPFYLFQTLPSPQWNDTLGIIIPPHDSITVSFYDVDLCPICDYEVQEYFKDTLRFVFSFLDGVSYSFSNSIQISGEGHLSDVVSDGVVPNEFVLYQNYPNPFNPSTKISWQSPISSWQTLKIYNVLGNEVATLVDEERPAGSYEIEFNASNLPAGRRGLSSGVYYYQLRAGSFVETKKLILLK